MQHIFSSAGGLTVVPYPGSDPRLLLTGGGVETAYEYRDRGGYRPVGSVAGLADEVERSGLRGRGGAGFPFAVKVSGVRGGSRVGAGAPAGWTDTVIVANGEEGEPASFKDRWLLRHRPHLVLDGLRLAAALVRSRRAYVYVSDPESARCVDSALEELGGGLPDGPEITVVRVEPGYVAGEETAAVQAINGGPAKPTDKPPRPFEAGVAGLPTLVSNVETLANLPFLDRWGADTYRAAGTALSPGTFLATVTAAGRAPALYELPHGLPFADLLALHGIAASGLRGALIGGYFTGLLDRTVLDLTLDHETLRRAGAGLGCGAIALITEECPVAVAAGVLNYFDRENAGQCGSCFNGTAAMAAAAGALADGRAGGDDLRRLRRWSTVLRGRGACGTLDAACNTAASLLDRFPREVTAHLGSRCPDCAAGPATDHAPYRVATEVLR
ncbi:NADH-ubiquinone oxidoreductase-F iron-sulfur binding region domain-containing protein [Nocardia jinanensis]|uniref:NADH dehydrogenase n=1 Tax=Nocardia jinanensis TaxID=382504 RepID=A0A917RQ27_9NOCA|nr:NADH-ubiquinone oxidoreductase-F iron-sulfur binding region domain-containing protein [Nocardia jinanensis]GGL17998.1 NADH dehydrogenase [Nocardia jinanensis]